MHVNIKIKTLPKQFIFCRHAESIGNARGLDDNSTKDTANHQFGLSPKGQRQVEQVRDFLRHRFSNGFSEYYVSSFLRTQITFQGVWGKDISPYEDPRLDEWWKGIFHSLTKEEIAEHYPVESATLKREGWYHYRPPQGESGKDVEMRILSYLNSLNPTESVFISGHGRWFCFFKRLLLKLPRERMNLEAPKNGSVISLTKNGSKYESNVLFTPK
ncbi:histidine phosphatase family protein [Candidatus Nomurabacteria bacterium]|nr:histidine phosphatase family protein [Candidatus Nomurabacteria bacterium]